MFTAYEHVVSHTSMHVKTMQRNTQASERYAVLSWLMPPDMVFYLP